ncbi:MAG: hypothetical protein RLZZ506_1268, partial [Bacteroidota bacterium]
MQKMAQILISGLKSVFLNKVYVMKTLFLSIFCILSAAIMAQNNIVIHIDG